MAIVLRHVVRGVASLLLMAGVIVLGQVPLGKPTGQAVIRVALRSTQARREVCRDRTAAELEALPLHMREPRVCDTYAPPFRLRLAIDGQPLVDRLVEPGGLKGDRPLILSEELAVPPGVVELTVTWIPEDDMPPPGPFREALAELPRFELEQEVTLVADRIMLIELDDANDSLLVYGQRAAD